MHELLTDARYLWHGPRNFVEPRSGAHAGARLPRSAGACATSATSTTSSRAEIRHHGAGHQVPAPGDGGRRAARGGRPALVQGRRHLPAARQGVLRLQRRRHRRLPRPHRRSSTTSSDLGVNADLAAALLSVAAEGRRLRRRRLPQRPPAVRHARRLPALPARGAPRGASRSSPSSSSTTRRTSTRGSRPRAARRAGSTKRDYYVWSDDPTKYAGTRIIFTDTETSNWAWDDGREGVLLAPLLQPSAGSQLRQSAAC